MSRPSLFPRCGRTPLFGLALAMAMPWIPAPASAGGQGRDIPPYVLPVRQTELRIASQAQMVCVADPGTVCVAPYLDAEPGSNNTDGGTFRSASCPGGPPHGACRPDYIVGAEITGELVIDWPITKLENIPQCGSSPSYEICHDGHMELNLTAPGVTVANPVWELDDARCDCIDPEFQTDSWFNGARIDAWWQTREVGAICDIALEYSEELVPRETLLAIGQLAFPALLCQADANGACTLQPVPVLVEADGSLTKGCGDPPSDTFTIRFAEPNEPIAFVRKPLPDDNPFSSLPEHRDVADIDGDGDADLIPRSAATLFVNDGTNGFSEQPSGLPPTTFNAAAVADWNDDGDADLVGSPATNPATGVKVYPGDGAGSFDEPTSFLIDATGATVMKAADLNADGLPDAVSGTSSATRVIWNQTDGPIAPAVDAVTMHTDTLVDFDADMDTDVVGGLSSGAVEWSSNGGPGGFSSAQNAVTVPTAADALVPLLGQEIVDVLRCDEYSSDCCSAHGGLGCDDTTCEAIVCNQDSDCCNFGWEGFCQEIALEQCGTCMDPTLPDCCTEDVNRAGCEITACEDAVATQTGGCDASWDDFCADVARGLCRECHVYNVLCSTTVVDVGAADADADGDVDLFLSMNVSMDLIHSATNDREANAGYFAWIPNLQVDDPGSSGGNPLFDPGVESWRLLGPSAADEDSSVGGQLEMIDLDGDNDPDAVGVGFWYRNEGGTFTGPHALGLGSAARGCGVDGLVGNWRFNGNGLDATGCDHDGTVSGPALTTDVDGTADSAYAFDGTADVVNLGSAPSLEPDLPITLSMWIRHDCVGLCRVFGNDVVNGGNYSGFWVNVFDGGKLAAGYGDGTGAGSSDRRSAETTAVVLTPNVWHHAAILVWKAGSIPSFRFLVDGVSSSHSTSGTGGDLAYLGNDALIGNDSSGGAGFEGDLDEIRLYGRHLTDEEVAALAAPGDPLATKLLDPAENLKLDTLFTKDLDGDADMDVVGREELWEQVEALPEPGSPLALGAGIIALLALRRAGRSHRTSRRGAHLRAA